MIPTDDELLEEVAQLQWRVLAYEAKLLPLLPTRAAIDWWKRTEGAYRWAVSELTERGFIEPPLPQIEEIA